MPGGYTPTLPILGIVHISQRPNDHFFSASFSRTYALFQVTYPVSPLLATLTKTAGCISKIPILELVAPASGTPFSRLASVAPGFLRSPLIPFFFPLPVNFQLSTVNPFFLRYTVELHCRPILWPNAFHLSSSSDALTWASPRSSIALPARAAPSLPTSPASPVT